MGTIHIALVGRDTDNIVNGIMKQGGDELYPITSEQYLQQSVPEIVRRLPAVRVHSEINGRSLMVDPFCEKSFVTIVGLIIEIVQARKRKETDILINITGGTNLMSAAAVTGAMLTGAGAYYVNRDPEREQFHASIIDLPLIMDSVKLLGNERRKKILHLLAGVDERTNDELASTLMLGKKSVSKLIMELEGKGLVRSRKEGKHRKNSITDEGRIAASLM